MIETITANWPLYAVLIPAVLGLFSAIARITPNKADNKLADALWKFVNKLGLRGGPTLCVLLALEIGIGGCGKMQIDMIDAQKEPVKIMLRAGGRSCLAATIDSAGTIDVIVQQDASSDWLSLRIIPTLVQGAITTFFGKVNPNPDGISGPSGIHGCGEILNNGDQDK